MKKIIILLAMTLSLSMSRVFAAAVVTKITGDVEVAKTLEGTWIRCQEGMNLEQDDRLKTAGNGGVELSFLDGSRVWVKEDTEITISQLIEPEEETGLIAHLKLIAGKIRARVNPEAKNKTQFKAETEAAVMAIRGTEFIVVYRKGENSLIVLSGKVALKSILSEKSALVEKGHISVIKKSGELILPRKLTKKEEKTIQKEWKKQFKEQKKEDSKKEEDQKLNLRKELKKFVNTARVDVRRSIDVTNEIQESDFATGRTLLDVHKNVVRVEQHIRRPGTNSFKFINLTKRQEYKYNGKFTYRGDSGSRLDIMETDITFNADLPEQINDWPKFFIDNDDVEPTTVYMLMKNGQDNKLEWKGRRVTDIRGDSEMEMDLFVNGRKTYDVDESITDLPVYDVISGEEDGDLWMYVSTPINFDPDNTNRYDDILQVEMYGIDDEGNILSLDYFTQSKEIDPFTLLKKSAGQGIVSFRGNTFTGNNIDIVATPDIAVPVLRSLVTSGDLISSDESDE